MKSILSIFSCFLFLGLLAQEHQTRYNEIDIRHYEFELELSDETNEIKGEAIITVRFKDDVSEFYLDLTGKDNDGKGMTVEKVICKDHKTTFEHQENRLTIQSEKPFLTDEIWSFEISYSGIPTDGLIISENKYGNRTFFGDNWPDRAQNWLPVVDHPSDKASVEFLVTAPNHYQVVASGQLLEKSNMEGDKMLTHWSEKVPLPTKVMVIGVAQFAVELAGSTHDIPVTSWVYPENRKNGFYDYAQAVEVLDYFIKTVGAYPYQKLANVQSKTRYGGMENAGNIFYYENSVNGKREIEDLIAHEIAHQWFGNSASEMNWHHIWLSEGFATYMADLYLEHKYGNDYFRNRLKEERQKVIRFASFQMTPILDTTITDYNKLLTPNVYEKGGWFLHMLRREMGDDKFMQGIKIYYDQFKLANALTDDFRDIMESVHGKDMQPLFHQWLNQPGHPEILAEWDYDNENNEFRVMITQTQKDTEFRFLLDIELMGANGKDKVITVPINSKITYFSFKTDKETININLDPDTWLLFKGEVKKTDNMENLKD